jgi:hypothetical protein
MPALLQFKEDGYLIFKVIKRVMSIYSVQDAKKTKSQLLAELTELRKKSQALRILKSSIEIIITQG